ncbi:MAG: ABC transporter permease [Firmicutes bacterium]|jgi:fluoroquinolone transport system permease protein|nr:ABC transporter permease [Bacillota bacterium]
MKTLRRLIAGELQRLMRYKIVPVSLATAGLWIVLFWFLSPSEAVEIAPLLIFVDAVVMSILLLGAAHHLEKQEGTIKTMMVMPISPAQILASKTAASMVLALESAVVTAAALFFIHKVTFNYLALIVFVAVAAAAHAAIGFVLSLKSKDFTTMLVALMGYMFIFTIPSLLFSFGAIAEKYEWLLMLSPSHSASHLITAAVRGEYKGAMAAAGCIYLVVLAAALFRLAVYPAFKANAVRG